VDSQNSGSSGRQSSIHLPDLPDGGCGGAETVFEVIVVWAGWVGAAMRRPSQRPVSRASPRG